MSRKRLYVVDGKYYNFEKGEVTVGGVQTYVTDLVQIALSVGFDITVFAIDPLERETKVNGYTIKGYKVEDSTKGFEDLAHKVKASLISDNDLVLYDTDGRLPLKTRFNNILCIQHGICWDIPDYRDRSFLRMLLASTITAFNTLRRINTVPRLVCVDYNFVNWYRTKLNNAKKDLVVIPNYTRVAPEYEKPENVINIIFARRLIWYRGTRVFTEAIKRILCEFRNIHVTVAGDGPDEKWMHEQLDQFSNVTFTRYLTGESLEIHSDKHISIVPTVGSEGTSLSLLEAMSAQCAVVCTNVGGMTNIVLDGYNGKMVNAGSVDELYYAIKYLLDNPSEIDRLAQNAYETVKQSFSFERWASQWEKVLKSYL